jgi:hypothetical protein
MSHSTPDAARTRLRASLAALEEQIHRLPVGPVDDGVRASFVQLVDQLALGPEPRWRNCPTCQHVGMEAATRCGFCWSKLPPLHS